MSGQGALKSADVLSFEHIYLVLTMLVGVFLHIHFIKEAAR